MKRLLTASLIILIILGICLFENFYIYDCFEDINVILNDMQTDFLNSATIKNERFSTLNEAWRKSNNLLTAFINREQILEISDNINLLQNIYKNDRNDFLTSVQSIILQLEEIKKYETFNCYGVL